MIRVAADAIVEIDGKILLVDRKYEPLGLALPGGHLDEGETMEQAVARELKEETGLIATHVEQFRTYSDPKRDPRGHCVSTIFIVNAKGEPKAADDAKAIVLLSLEEIEARKNEFVFDHYQILQDYKERR